MLSNLVSIFVQLLKRDVTRFDPIKPAAPVTRTVFSFKEIFLFNIAFYPFADFILHLHTNIYIKYITKDHLCQEVLIYCLYEQLNGLKGINQESIGIKRNHFVVVVLAAPCCI